MEEEILDDMRRDAVNYPAWLDRHYHNWRDRMESVLLDMVRRYLISEQRENGYYDVMDDELKFIYYCPKCGQRYVTGREAEWTCDDDGARLHPLTVEHWDCNGEFEYEEEYHEYVRGNL